MKNFISEGKSIEVVAAGAVASGEVKAVGKLVGVAVSDAQTSEKYTLDIKGIFNVPCASADDIAVGDELYWDGSEMTKVIAGNTFAGYAVQASGVGVTEVEIVLK